MDKTFVVKLAFRNLFLHKMRTVLTLVGIVIGISAVVFLISFGTGIQRLVTSQITNGDAFSLIDIGTGNSQITKLNNDIITKVKGITQIKQIETVTNLGGKAKIDSKVMDITVFGVSSPSYLDWSGKKIQYGQNLPAAGDNTKKAIINSAYVSFLTKGTAQSLIGQEITYDLILPKELSSTGEAQTFAGQKFTVVGIIKDTATPSLYSNIDNFSGASATAYSQLIARADNRNNVESIRKKIEAYGLKTDYVGDTVSQVQQFFNIFEIVLGSFGLIALIVALLGMFNTLTISLLERIKEVALMQIFGMSRKDVRNLFLVEALVLGAVGGLLGIGWGVFLGKLANFIFNIFATNAGGDKVSVFYYAPWLLIASLAGAIFVGFITGIYPASRASRVNPLDVLRYE